MPKISFNFVIHTTKTERGTSAGRQVLLKNNNTDKNLCNKLDVHVSIAYSIVQIKIPMDSDIYLS